MDDKKSQKTEEKWYANASATDCGSVIIFVLSSSWVTV
jgi:hypothetical protein